ncbi:MULTISPECIES: hypothetical protein [unclassified Amycolatopsis]|uniref:hypothetical protein n=1 Tax=unclassified Amycolatopsis TaxID=2618356 RepID=UPI00106EE89A|nr:MULTISPECIES: hypothetical protein [unclassified Amycolatopsis]
MTTPAGRNAQQNYQRQVQQNSTTFARNAAYHAQLNRRRGSGGLARGLVGFLFSLVFIAIAVGVLLVVLATAQPEWFEHVKNWF